MFEVIISGNHGLLSVDACGFVRRSESRYDGPAYLPIERIDIVEWETHYGKRWGDLAYLDILDVGYWYRDEDQTLKHEEPEHDWREECRAHGPQEFFDGNNERGGVPQGEAK